MRIDEDKKLRKLMSERTGRVIAVDLDGTLAKADHWRGYKYIGPPIKKIVSLIRKEKKQNNSTIVIHSCRLATADNIVYPYSVTLVTRWLKKNKIPFDSIWLGTSKPFAHFYIDDRGLNPFCPECLKRLKVND